MTATKWLHWNYQFIANAEKKTSVKCNLWRTTSTAVPGSVVKLGMSYSETGRTAPLLDGLVENQDYVVEQMLVILFICWINVPSMLISSQVLYPWSGWNWWQCCYHDGEPLSISVLKVVQEPWLTWVLSLVAVLSLGKNSHVGAVQFLQVWLSQQRKNQSVLE